MSVAEPDVEAPDEASERAPLQDRLMVHLLGIRASGRFWGWAGPLLVTALAALLRFTHLGKPHQLVFDETYYVKQGYTMWRSGFENRWPETPAPDSQFTAGTPDIYLPEADFVVHPPVGKWMIALGEMVTGIDSAFGWRLSAAVCGTLMVLILARTARRMFGSTLLGCVAGLLLAVEGHHVVHSRTGLLDIFLAFWVLCGFSALIVDRDHARAVLARKTAALDGAQPRGLLWLGVRPWRLLAAVCFGLAMGTKLSGGFFFAVLAVFSVLWDFGARRAAGERHWWLSGLNDGLQALVTTVPVVIGTYIASWWGWFANPNAWNRRWAQVHPPEHLWERLLPGALRGLIKYHQDVMAFHVSLTSPHPYQSNPWSWLVQTRPTSFFYESPGRDLGCPVDNCSKAITSVGNVVIWWGGTVALVILLFTWLLARDWRAGAILAGVAAGWLPWFNYQHRTIFTFYSVAFVAFVVLALTYALGLAIGPRGAPRSRRMAGTVLAGAVVTLAVVWTAWFWPLLVGNVIPYEQWRQRMLFNSWI